jgi:hypothetical protein
MSDDFGPIIPVVSPLLERIGKEERLNGDHPRRSKYLKSKTAKKDPDSTPSDDTEKTDDSTSSLHIDLRI